MVVHHLAEHAATLEDAAIARVREVALNEPLLVNRIVSERGHVTAVNVAVQLPGENTATVVPEVVAFSRRLAEALRQNHPAIDAHVSGMVTRFGRRGFRRDRRPGDP